MAVARHSHGSRSVFKARVIKVTFNRIHSMELKDGIEGDKIMGAMMWANSCREVSC
jgi:hypothetical protein